eukprot:7564288-Pyramimonas_sp.AAC.1
MLGCVIGFGLDTVAADEERFGGERFGEQRSGGGGGGLERGLFVRSPLVICLLLFILLRLRGADLSENQRD